MFLKYDSSSHSQLIQHTDKSTHDSEAPKLIHFLNIIMLLGNYTAYDSITILVSQWFKVNSLSSI